MISLALGSMHAHTESAPRGCQQHKLACGMAAVGPTSQRLVASAKPVRINLVGHPPVFSNTGRTSRHESRPVALAEHSTVSVDLQDFCSRNRKKSQAAWPWHTTLRPARPASPDHKRMAGNVFASIVWRMEPRHRAAAQAGNPESCLIARMGFAQFTQSEPWLHDRSQRPRRRCLLP